MTSNPDFKVTILFNVKLLKNGTRQSYIYNGGLRAIDFGRTNTKSYDLSNGAIFSDLERLLPPGFKVTPFFDADYLRNDTRYIVSMECQKRLTHALLNSVISNDKIFDDTKHRAASLRQQSYFLKVC